MRYFYDTEFLQTPTGYDLISIAVVAEDGHTYEATNVEAPTGTASTRIPGC